MTILAGHGYCGGTSKEDLTHWKHTPSGFRSVLLRPSSRKRGTYDVCYPWTLECDRDVPEVLLRTFEVTQDPARLRAMLGALTRAMDDAERHGRSISPTAKHLRTELDEMFYIKQNGSKLEFTPSVDKNAVRITSPEDLAAYSRAQITEVYNEVSGSSYVRLDKQKGQEMLFRVGEAVEAEVKRQVANREALRNVRSKAAASRKADPDVRKPVKESSGLLREPGKRACALMLDAMKKPQTVEQLASATGISVSSIRSYLTRIRRKSEVLNVGPYLGKTKTEQGTAYFVASE